jgi:hypothetical protein
MPRLRPLALALAAALALTGTTAAAQCFADYRARRDTPYALIYGVIELPAAACGSREAAAAEIARRIGRGGFALLDVRGIFGPEGLEPRRANAGEYFLNF